MSLVNTLVSFILTIGGFAVLVSVALQMSAGGRSKARNAR